MKANRGWLSINCRNYNISDSIIFSQILSALNKWPRNDYFALDMSWIADLMQPFARVEVECVNWDQITNKVMSFQHHITLPYNRLEETYKIAFVINNNLVNNKFKTRDIDVFLRNNPCYFPIQEPSIRIRKLHKKGLSRSQSNNLSKLLSIFVRLPVYKYHATCRLFSLITQVQFPKQCLYTQENMTVYHLINTGWSAAFGSLFGEFIVSLSKFPTNVFVVPKAIEFKALEWIFHDKILNKQYNMSDIWKWIDPDTCDPISIMFDPWSCNFISFTNCTHSENGKLRRIHSSYPNATDSGRYEIPIFILRNGLDSFHSYDNLDYQNISIAYLRTLFDDALLLDDSQWAIFRILTFLQRPNFRLRYLIREFNFDILPIPTKPISENNKQLSKLNSNTGNNNQDNIFNNGFILSRPCLVIHVRNGDANDWRISYHSKIDRTLAGHVRYARNLTRDLGIKNIFLASDNETVIQNAPFEYPEYIWFTQRRPIKDLSQDTYEVRNEDSVQKDLARILVDMRTTAKCDGMVGSMDSSMAESMFTQHCAMHRDGAYLPSVDLREVHYGLTFK
eukprot:gene7087-9672_t